MKKQLLLLLSLPSLAFAQTIPNGAFENWTTVNYDNPNYFYSANSDRAKETGMATVFKVTGSSGFAVRGRPACWGRWLSLFANANQLHRQIQM
jgi:hypothetical protein